MLLVFARHGGVAMLLVGVVAEILAWLSGEKSEEAVTGWRELHSDCLVYRGARVQCGRFKYDFKCSAETAEVRRATLEQQ